MRLDREGRWPVLVVLLGKQQQIKVSFVPWNNRTSCKSYLLDIQVIFWEGNCARGDRSEYSRRRQGTAVGEIRDDLHSSKRKRKVKVYK